MNKVSKIRAPHRVHILSWVLSLDSKGCIPCHYKNCNFMAMTLDEMVAHFHFARCSSEFQFTCNVCNLSTDLEVKLLFHRIYVHSHNATPEEQREVFSFLGVKKEISANLRKGWLAYLENKGFLKCLNRACLYVPRSLDEMEEHYMYQCKENFWSILVSQCTTCGGRFECGERMTNHAQSFHTSVTESVRIFKNTYSVEEHSPVWAKHILANKQANCPVPGCMFVSNNLILLSKHYKICTGKKQKEYMVCYYCHCWLQTEAKLLEHMKCLHKGLEIQMVTQPSCEEPSPEAPSQTQKNPTADESETKLDCNDKKYAIPNSDPKRRKNGALGEAYKCMKRLTDKESSYLTSGKIIADNLKMCNRPLSEIFMAQNQINNIIFKLQMGGFASEVGNLFSSPSSSGSSV